MCWDVHCSLSNPKHPSSRLCRFSIPTQSLFADGVRWVWSIWHEHLGRPASSSPWNTVCISDQVGQTSSAPKAKCSPPQSFKRLQESNWAQLFHQKIARVRNCHDITIFVSNIEYGHSWGHSRGQELSQTWGHLNWQKSLFSQFWNGTTTHHKAARHRVARAAKANWKT